LVCFVSNKQNRKKEVKRVQVTFTMEQWNIIKQLKGIMGNEDAEIVRNIVLAWLAEKSIIGSQVKSTGISGEEK